MASMRRHAVPLRFCAAFLLLASGRVARPQLVEVRPIDPTYCEKLRVRPNLVLHNEELIAGRIIDQSGAPFKSSRVELRAYRSETEQPLVEATATDQDGRFRFRKARAGKYRLLASPTRAFKQSEALMCSSSGDCTLSISLQVNATDEPDSQCPVK